MDGPYRHSVAPSAIPRNCFFCGGDVVETPAGHACAQCSLRAVPSEGLPGTLTCPRCSTPFERRALEPRTVSDATVHVCTACRGCFVRGPDWDALVVKRTEAKSAPDAAAPIAPPTATFEAVRCPACAREMDRATFAVTSPVVIDVCPPHGVWFDAGELAAALAYEGTPQPGGIDRWVQRQEQFLKAEAPVIGRALRVAEANLPRREPSKPEDWLAVFRHDR